MNRTRVQSFLGQFRCKTLSRKCVPYSSASWPCQPLLGWHVMTAKLCNPAIWKLYTLPRYILLTPIFLVSQMLPTKRLLSATSLDKGSLHHSHIPHQRTIGAKPRKQRGEIQFVFPTQHVHLFANKIGTSIFAPFASCYRTRVAAPLLSSNSTNTKQVTPWKLY